jgi:hypothetical protein
MIVISRAMPRLAMLLGMTMGLAIVSSEGRAYTAEQQQACTPDAFRLCSSEIPDIDRIKACMVRNKAQLSPECRAAFRAPPESGDVAPAAAHKFRSHRIKKPRPDDT